MTSAFGDQASPMMTSANNVGEGWHPLLHKLEEELNAIDPDFELLQVKEKFGGLQYYAHTRERGDVYQEFQEALRRAESESERTCEKCGEPGRQGRPTKYWIKTLCDKHFDEMKEKESS